MSLLCSFSGVLYASERVHGVRVFLSNGDPEQAILTAKVLLKRSDIRLDERFELRKLIAYAEEMRAQARHYESIEPAIQALKILEKKFPKRVHQVSLHWRMIWLYWKHGDNTIALQQARQLRAKYGDTPEAGQAAMLMARIHIQQHKYRQARDDLMRYGLNAALGSREESLTKAWLAVVDHAEKRDDMAVKQLDQVYRHFPDIIRKDPYVFSAYILSLYQVGRKQDALHQADDFLSRYIEADEAPEVRLLRADLWRYLHAESEARIEREYDVLAEKQAEYTIGKQAFMRKLMLVYAKSQTYYELKPVILALKRLAKRNQLSVVENEAMFDLGVLWARLSHSDPEHAPKQALFAALDDFSRVVSSDIPAFRTQAHAQGAALFNTTLDHLAKQQAWEKVVALWERYPRLRGQSNIVKERAFEVAHALRMLMDYEQAEQLLNRLYHEAKGTVWGQKVMLERAYLWVERGDADAIAKMMAWLDEHEYTLYRPEMLLLVAKTQVQSGKPKMASQTLQGIAVEDIALEDRRMYWEIQANIAEALKQWHVAVSAWKHYAQSQGSDQDMALLHQADALFHGAQYQQANALYAKVNKAQRDAAWMYHVAICQLNLGQEQKALAALEQIKTDAQAGIYASLASVELADRKAQDILRKHP